MLPLWFFPPPHWVDWGYSLSSKSPNIFLQAGVPPSPETGYFMSISVFRHHASCHIVEWSKTDVLVKRNLLTPIRLSMSGAFRCLSDTFLSGPFAALFSPKCFLRFHGILTLPPCKLGHFVFLFFRPSSCIFSAKAPASCVLALFKHFCSWFVLLLY